MENPEEVLQCLEEFAKLRPKDIPRELEEYLCFVAKTGDPVYQWSTVKSLFREKLLNVISEFYESCPSIDIPPCPNVDVFNYEAMKSFILEKLDTFNNAPFTVQRICELLTTPRKEYNRIDKYMRALEKNILVVSTTEPGNRRNAENGDGFVNGIETEHNNDINVEEMDDNAWGSGGSHHDVADAISQGQKPAEPETQQNPSNNETENTAEALAQQQQPQKNEPETSKSAQGQAQTNNENLFVSIEPVVSSTCSKPTESEPDDTITITAVPAAVQKRRDSIEPVVSSDVPSEPVSSSKDAEMTDGTSTVREPEASSVAGVGGGRLPDDQGSDFRKSDESTDTDESIERNELSVLESKEISFEEQMDTSTTTTTTTTTSTEEGETPQIIPDLIKETITSTTDGETDLSSTEMATEISGSGETNLIEEVTTSVQQPQIEEQKPGLELQQEQELICAVTADVTATASASTSTSTSVGEGRGEGDSLSEQLPAIVQAQEEKLLLNEEKECGDSVLLENSSEARSKVVENEQEDSNMEMVVTENIIMSNSSSDSDTMASSDNSNSAVSSESGQNSDLTITTSLPPSSIVENFNKNNKQDDLNLISDLNSSDSGAASSASSENSNEAKDLQITNSADNINKQQHEQEQQQQQLNFEPMDVDSQ